MTRKLIATLGLLGAAACGTQEMTPQSPEDLRGQTARQLLTLPANTILPTETGADGTAAGMTTGSASVTSEGRAAYTLPIWVPTGRAGMEPELSLAYRSDGGNGLLGAGWTLRGLSAITRCRKTVAQDGLPERVTFTSQDVFCLDGQRLVAIQGEYGASNTLYRTEQDSFARVVSLQADALGPTQFKVYQKDGRILTFGALNNSTFQGERISARPLGEQDISVERDGRLNRFSWALTQVEDRSGNYLSIRYSQVFNTDDSTYEHFPVEISYAASSLTPARGPTRFISFDYETRPDAGVSYVSGFKTKQSRRLSTLAVLATDPATNQRVVLRRYNLRYTTEWLSERSLLQSLQECDGSGVCKRPVTFGWSANTGAFSDTDTGLTDITDKGSSFLEPGYWTMQPVDLDGDGRDDLAFRRPFNTNGQTFEWAVHHASPSGYGPAMPLSLVYQDCPTTNVHEGRWVDINLDGRVDVGMVETPRCEYETGSFEHRLQLRTRTAAGSWNLASDVLHGRESVPPKFSYADLDGDGFVDLIRRKQSSTSPGLRYSRNVSGQFSPAVDIVPSETAESEAYALDLDGSGRTSLLTKERVPGTQTTRGKRYFAVRFNGTNFDLSETTLVRSDVNDKPYIFLDINGDGLMDAVRTPETGGDLEIQMNTGDGFAPPIFQDLSQTFEVGAWKGDNGLRPIDFNLDGRHDLLLMDNRGGVRTQLVVLMSDGSKFLPVSLNIPVGRSVGNSTPGSYRLSQVMDANGDGLTDLAQVVNGTLHVYTRQGMPPALLTSVSDSLGARVEFGYKPMTDASVYTRGTACTAPQTCLKSGQWLVSELRRDTGLPSLRVERYQYEDGRADVQGRGMLGFSKVTVTDLSTGRKVETTYDLTTRSGTFYPYAKLPAVETTWTPIPPRFHTLTRSIQYRHTLTPGASGGQILRVFPEVTTETQAEGDMDRGDGVPGPASPLRWITTTWGYDDAYGNLVSRQFSLNGGVETKSWSAQYHNLESAWLIGLPHTVTESSTASGDTVTRTRSLQYVAGTALLEKETLEPGSPDLELSTTYVRAPDGVVSQILRAAPGLPTRATTLEYGTADRTFPTATVNALNHREEMLYHWGLGVLAVSVNANGVRTAWQYDGFGRVRKEDGPEQADSTTSYGWAPPGGNDVLQVLTTQAGGQEALVTADRLGRTLTTRTRTFQGGFTRTTQEYDAQGRIAKVWQTSPLNPSQQVFTEYLFDALNRQTGIRYPDQTSTSSVYDGLRVRNTDAKGALRVIQQHPNGKPELIEEYVSPSSVLQTRYVYGPFDTLKKVTDPQGNETVMTFDRLGRRTELRDPDSGLSVTRYNPFGEVRETVDAKGTTTTFLYDVLGRKTRASNGVDGVSRLVWDTAAHGLGQLASSTQEGDPGTPNDDITIVHTFDALGRPAADTWGVDGRFYSIDHGYDVYSRLRTLTYPGVGGQRLSVEYAYTDWGQLQRVNDSITGSAYWTAESRNALGQLTRETFGNGIISQRAYDVNGYLRFIDSKRGTVPVQALAFEYGPSGNLHSRHDLIGKSTEDFVHDDLDRLTQWSVFQNCRSSTLEYPYDSLGNLLGSEVVTGTGVASTLFYEKTNGAGPHAVTRSQEGSYTYDLNGNQVSAPGRIVTYTSFRLPSSLSTTSGTTTFRYDAHGTRTVKVLPGGEKTVYVGGLYEMRSAPDGSELHAFNIQGAERTVAQVLWRAQAGQQATSERRLFLHTDHLGSVETTTDDLGQVVARMKYEPFGGRRFAQDLSLPQGQVSWESFQGFTGHEHDEESGLINMRGRIYDPKLGRFLSPDPFIQAPLRSQSFNRYSYVLNNPLRFTDPSGYLAMDTIIVYDSWYGGYTALGGGYVQTVTNRHCEASDGCEGLLTEVNVTRSMSPEFSYFLLRMMEFSFATEINRYATNARLFLESDFLVGFKEGFQHDLESLRPPQPPPYIIPTQNGDGSINWDGVFQETQTTAKTIAWMVSIVSLFDGMKMEVPPAGANARFSGFVPGQPRTNVEPPVSTPAPGKTLPWSSKALKQAEVALEQGATSVHVGSRAEAEELFLGRYAGEGYRNVTKMSPTEAKNFFGGKAGSYHWDEGPDAFPHGQDHLQVHTYGGDVIRIYF
ncbi:hypothetical protein JY651_21645 [Pyxidicoccus parkwayensis]|uniref:Insecticide toxin TcdB middle/N-terminal domain-containing protein n=1 Tax=Pyxidicoccus parkwayensis TaxID=2813578 RepID=A0ABX7PA76_9BACT|nr:RHS repeat-associated core domain-containing protein [Pyxidicoccus parkwaysis]QSQ27350.1 hypothetical protein JY651_21645 [Pyxidicoccus parkwaysis]